MYTCFSNYHRKRCDQKGGQKCCENNSSSHIFEYKFNLLNSTITSDIFINLIVTIIIHFNEGYNYVKDYIF